MTFQDDINRIFAEEFARALADVRLRPGTPDLMVDPELITVHKSASYLPVSLDQLVDSGALSEAEARAQGWTPYVPPPVPWSSRLRWRWQAWRERAGRKIGGWIAGVDLSERDEDW